ncbi:GNAT family N-acetyltransferase [Mycolicibacterium sarraceniae]|uniref:N-acetyltransferase GCN5 n=1 Tax=Mycolicibacterium sarraceniae TaxID=1534348 RepID=A0A7I7SUA7_9MYCO|nr:GNAT family N-acetyltransferase [Mycolicibacterium sarraceniae]BBY60273.1 N-acetyltransferase GCN5 [Mycolicibacterium sarraceniae]
MSRYSLPRPITDSDDSTTFDSGASSLDSYLRKRALANHVTGASRCFVTCCDGRVVGYYALATGAVSHDGCSGRFRRNMPDPIPVILLSRLAIDVKHQHRGLGESLLRDAIARSVLVAEQVGVRAILVHALHDEARQFYLRYGFEPSPTDPLQLMLLVKDVKASVASLRGENDAADQRGEFIDRD